MEEVLRDLLGIRAVNFRPLEYNIESDDFTPLGVADSVPDFGTSGDEVFIWHASAGILPITARELIRFGMDAPRGLNLIFSERQLQPDCNSLDTFDFKIIEPKEISNWIGQAVLSGELNVSAISSHNQIMDQSTIPNIIHSEISVLRPLIDNKNWANNRGMEGFSSSPILLSARLWSVVGDLLGPNGERENRKWEIVEDPWSQTLSLLNGIEHLQRAPVLRSIDPLESNWLSRSSLYEEISKIIEERRRGESRETSTTGTVRSMLLEKWSLNIETASISFSKILIPGWEVDLNPKKILHGRNGRLYDS